MAGAYDHSLRRKFGRGSPIIDAAAVPCYTILSVLSIIVAILDLCHKICVGYSFIAEANALVTIGVCLAVFIISMETILYFFKERCIRAFHLTARQIRLGFWLGFITNGVLIFALFTLLSFIGNYNAPTIIYALDE